MEVVALFDFCIQSAWLLTARQQYYTTGVYKLKYHLRDEGEKSQRQLVLVTGELLWKQQLPGYTQEVIQITGCRDQSLVKAWEFLQIKINMKYIQYVTFRK